MNNTMLLHFDNCTLKLHDNTIFKGFNWTIQKGENWVITGNSGSGKTSLLKAIEGKMRIAAGSVIYGNTYGQTAAFTALRNDAAFVYFQDSHIRYKNYYYQQRYHSTEVEGTFTVADFLFGNSPTARQEFAQHNYPFEIGHQLDEEFIKLSNGENRKVLITKALLRKPKILILDNPYNGLDQQSRNALNHSIDTIIAQGISVILACNTDSFPSKMDHILLLDCMQVQQKQKIENSRNTSPRELSTRFPLKFAPPADNSFNIAVRLESVSIRYGEKQILKDINWTIRRGEKWALSGENGSGKTMLASLLNADNPQAYAHKITLFDKLRGPGQSIWDVKERVAYLSPEQQIYQQGQLTCRNTVLSVLREHPFKHRKPNSAELEMLDSLFTYFQIEHLRDRPIHELSTGQQRLVYFIRAIFKNPALLILDEPFQNFDHAHIAKARELLDYFCIHRTLIFISHHVQEIPTCVNRHAQIHLGTLRLR
jgi:molybdate transport system ATP-binding protein